MIGEYIWKNKVGKPSGLGNLSVGREKIASHFKIRRNGPDQIIMVWLEDLRDTRDKVIMVHLREKRIPRKKGGEERDNFQ